MRIVYLCLWICSGAVLAICALARPEWLDHRNKFLDALVSHEILNVYGVFVAISLASASQIQLALNHIEEKKGSILFDPVRKELKNSCFVLVMVFAGAVISLVIKPLVADVGAFGAFINGLNLWFLVVYITVLWDMTRSVFAIRAQVGGPRRSQNANSESGP